MPRIAAIIVTLILERPTCLECLAPKAGLDIGDAETSLRRVGDAFRIQGAHDRCRVCGETKATIVLERNGGRGGDAQRGRQPPARVRPASARRK